MRAYIAFQVKQLSGILGIYYRDGRPVDQQVLASMMEAIAHRGTDDRGTWTNGAVGMGHQMRWITPESLTEKLPLYKSEPQLTITADARIDNREELFTKLDVPKNQRAALADSEAILLSYQKWGEQCVDHLLGDFAFAIWDERNKQLFCAKDHMGIRPFYFYASDKLFAFASEIKALLKIPEVPKKLNEEQFARYLIGMLYMEKKEDTCFEKVHMLTAGRTFVIQEKHLKQKSYWQPQKVKPLKLKSEEEYLEAFRELFFEAVHCRMRSAYPIASLLSGGLDSSAISAVAALKLKEKGERLVALSSVLPEDHNGPEQDERYFIDLVRDMHNIDVCYITPPGNGVYDNLEDVFRYTENPGITSRHYVYSAFLKKAAERKTRTLLDGFGGEFTATSYGKGYHTELALRGKWLQLATTLYAQGKIEQKSVKMLFAQQVIKPLVPSSLLILARLRRRNLSIQDNCPLHPHLSVISKLNARFTSSQFGGAYEKQPHNVLQNEIGNLKRVRDMFYDINGRSIAAISYPYLDRRVIDFSLSLPSNLKVNHGWRRYLLRASSKKILPQEISWRTTKQPFSPDYPKRLMAAQNSARHIIQSVDLNNPIREFIDFDKISRHLVLLEDNRYNSHSDIYSAFGKTRIIQQGIFAIVFLQTFSKII